jgi:ketosteroid isomerase-like protein
VSGNSEPSALTVVETFLAAIEARDFEAARGCLGQQRFSYLGPTRTFDRADDYVAYLSLFDPIMHRLERRRTFVDGADVCVILDFLTTMTGLERVRVAQWLTVQAGRITRIEVFLDASPYNQLFEGGSA